jgi:alkylation response protein AidB-like acyl-CoA dehydrogenase
MEQFGRRLLASPYLASAVLAAGALVASDDEAAMNEHLPGIASGDTIATLAVTEADGAWDIARSATTATRRGSSEFRVSGQKLYVLDGVNADLLLVSATTPEGPTLLAVRAHDCSISAIPSIDLTRRLAKVTLDEAPATKVGAPGQAAELIDSALSRAAVALAASQAGGAIECVEFTTDYVRDRYQYGRPVGSFQAVKHRLADMLRAAEYARAAAYEAARIADDEAKDLHRAAAVARTFCSDAFMAVTAGTIQLHGGIGFTWEHPAHLYFRRARLDAVLLGDARAWRERLAGHLLSALNGNGAAR